MKEFDKELDRILEDITWVFNKKSKILTVEASGLTPKEAKEAIKQAVDKYVIGEVPPTEEILKYSDHLRGKFDLKLEQRQSLWGAK